MRRAEIAAVVCWMAEGSEFGRLHHPCKLGLRVRGAGGNCRDLPGSVVAVVSDVHFKLVRKLN